MALQPIPLATQSYQSRSVDVQGQRLINMYSEALPSGSEYPFLITSRNGLNEIALVYTVGDVQGAIRGMRVFGESLYVVVSKYIYRVDTDYSIHRVAIIYDDSYPVFIEDNFVELIFMTKSGNVVVLDASDVPQALTYTFTASSMTFAYQSVLSSDAALRAIYVGALADASILDPINPEDTLSVEATSDAVVRVLFASNSLIAFKERSVQFFYLDTNTGIWQPDVSRNISTIGIAGAFAVVHFNNQVFWLGNDSIIYTLNNYSAQKISTPAIDYAIEGYETISDCNCYAFVESGHKFIAFDFRSGDATWVYDIESNLWHERTTFNKNRWEINSCVVWNNKVIMGSSENQKLYELKRGIYKDGDGVFIERTVHTPPIAINKKNVFHSMIQLDTQEAVGDITGDYIDPQVMMSYSDTAGRVFKNEQWRSIGKAHEFNKRCIWRSLGVSGERIYRFKITDPVDVKIVGLYGDLHEGLA